MRRPWSIRIYVEGKKIRLVVSFLYSMIAQIDWLSKFKQLRSFSSLLVCSFVSPADIVIYLVLSLYWFSLWDMSSKCMFNIDFFSLFLCSWCQVLFVGKRRGFVPGRWPGIPADKILRESRTPGWEDRRGGRVGFVAITRRLGAKIVCLPYA